MIFFASFFQLGYCQSQLSLSSLLWMFIRKKKPLIQTKSTSGLCTTSNIQFVESIFSGKFHSFKMSRDTQPLSECWHCKNLQSNKMLVKSSFSIDVLSLWWIERAISSPIYRSHNR